MEDKIKKRFPKISYFVKFLVRQRIPIQEMVIDTIIVAFLTFCVMKRKGSNKLSPFSIEKRRGRFFESESQSKAIF